jgi:fermentation-respiration switch protein FrsA (DUF1100 family)
MKHYIPNSWLLIHAKNDQVIPYSCSVEFLNALEAQNVSHASLHTVDCAGHFRSVLDLFSTTKKTGLLPVLDSFMERVNQITDRTIRNDRNLFEHMRAQREFLWNGMPKHPPNHFAPAREAGGF